MDAADGIWISTGMESSVAGGLGAAVGEISAGRHRERRGNGLSAEEARRAGRGGAERGGAAGCAGGDCGINCFHAAVGVGTGARASAVGVGGMRVFHPDWIADAASANLCRDVEYRIETGGKTAD